MKDYRKGGIGQSPELNYLDEKHAARARGEERDAALSDFLTASGARCMWQQRVPMVGVLECFAVNGRIFITQRYQDSPRGAVTGWDVFIPANTDGRIAATLDALRAYLKGEAPPCD